MFVQILFLKKTKSINMFQILKEKKPEIMNHMKYMYIKNQMNLP
jgi:hypothetical protein